jgi:hypothetical protein
MYQHANLDKLAACYGNDVTGGALMHRLIKIKSDVEQMKLGLKAGVPREAKPAESAGNKSDTNFQPTAKSTKSRASTRKFNGVVNGRVKKTATRGARKSGPPGIAAKIMEMAVAEEEGYAVTEEGNVGGSSVMVKDEHADSAGGKMLLG